MYRATLCLLLLFPTTATTAADGTWSGRLVMIEEMLVPEVDPAAKRLYDAMLATWEARIEGARSRLDKAGEDEKAVLLADIAAYERAILVTRRRRGGRVQLDRITYTVRDAPLDHDAIVGSRAVLNVEGRSGTARVDRRAGNALSRDRWTEEATEHALAPPPPFDGQRRPCDDIRGYRACLRQMSLRMRVDGEDRQVNVNVFWTDELPNVYAVGLTEEDASAGLNARLASLPGLPLQVEWSAVTGATRYRIRVERVETPGQEPEGSDGP